MDDPNNRPVQHGSVLYERCDFCRRLSNVRWWPETFTRREDVETVTRFCAACVDDYFRQHPAGDSRE